VSQQKSHFIYSCHNFARCRYTTSICNQSFRSTQPCIHPVSQNRVPTLTGWVKVGMLPLLGDPIWHVSSCTVAVRLVANCYTPFTFHTLLTIWCIIKLVVSLPVWYFFSYSNQWPNVFGAILQLLLCLWESIAIVLGYSDVTVIFIYLFIAWCILYILQQYLKVISVKLQFSSWHFAAPCYVWVIWCASVHFCLGLCKLTNNYTTYIQPFYGPLGFCPGLLGWASTRKLKPGR